MAEITWTDVTSLPGAATLVAPLVSSTAQVMILAYVNGPGVAVNKLDGEDGATTKLARVHLAAHMASLDARGAAGGAGPVTGMSEGGVSVQYAQPSAAEINTSLGETAYGRVFQTLIMRSPKLRGFLVA